MLATTTITDAPHDPPLAAPVATQFVSSSGRQIPGESLERLERLDDVMFAALGGDAKALDQAADEWRAAVASIDRRLLEETRENYVRRARSRWRRSQRANDNRLTSGFAALEILGLVSE